MTRQRRRLTVLVLIGWVATGLLASAAGQKYAGRPLADVLREVVLAPGGRAAGGGRGRQRLQGAPDVARRQSERPILLAGSPTTSFNDHGFPFLPSFGVRYRF